MRLLLVILTVKWSRFWPRTRSPALLGLEWRGVSSTNKDYYIY